MQFTQKKADDYFSYLNLNDVKLESIVRFHATTKSPHERANIITLSCTILFLCHFVIYKSPM